MTTVSRFSRQNDAGLRTIFLLNLILKVTKISRFSRQIDAGLHVLNVFQWGNLVCVVVLFLETKLSMLLPFATPQM